MKINEVIDTEDENSYEKVKAFIESRCQPYLAEVGGFDNAIFKTPLFRGIQKYMHMDAKIEPVLQNRKPLDTPPDIQILMDKWFYKKTGINFRSSSVFASGSWGMARGYTKNDGPVVVVLPVGNYHYCWSPINKDVYEDLGHFIFKFDKFVGVNKERSTELLLANPALLTKFLNKGKYKLDTGLREALASGNEIMINCKEVMLVNQNWVNDNDDRLTQINSRRGLVLPDDWITDKSGIKL